MTTRLIIVLFALGLFVVVCTVLAGAACALAGRISREREK
jgi:hypothetical protein